MDVRLGAASLMSKVGIDEERNCIEPVFNDPKRHWCHPTILTSLYASFTRPSGKLNIDRSDRDPDSEVGNAGSNCVGTGLSQERITKQPSVPKSSLETFEVGLQLLLNAGSVTSTAFEDLEIR